MFDLIGGQVGGAIAAAIAIVVGFFGFAFKMRGMAIKDLEKDKATEQRNNEALKREIEKVVEQEKIQHEFNKVTEVVIKSSAADAADKLSKFNRD